MGMLLRRLGEETEKSVSFSVDKKEEPKVEKVETVEPTEKKPTKKKASK